MRILLISLRRENLPDRPRTQDAFYIRVISSWKIASLRSLFSPRKNREAECNFYFGRLHARVAYSSRAAHCKICKYVSARARTAGHWIPGAQKELASIYAIGTREQRTSFTRAFRTDRLNGLRAVFIGCRFCLSVLAEAPRRYTPRKRRRQQNCPGGN